MFVPVPAGEKKSQLWAEHVLSAGHIIAPRHPVRGAAPLGTLRRTHGSPCREVRKLRRPVHFYTVTQ
jgi:hypothetical protein